MDTSDQLIDFQTLTDYLTALFVATGMNQEDAATAPQRWWKPICGA
jgi:hypothetical protein